MFLMRLPLFYEKFKCNRSRYVWPDMKHIILHSCLTLSTSLALQSNATVTCLQGLFFFCFFSFVFSPKTNRLTIQVFIRWHFGNLFDKDKKIPPIHCLHHLGHISGPWRTASDTPYSMLKER